MSYLVLARKYRPSTFADIVGQDHVVRTLRNAIALGRVHHAFLFTGARGVGKTTTARVLARALNCEKGPTAEPCGVCAACTEIVSGASPDVIEIDGASNNGVDNVRELRETARYMPSRGRFKLYIIDEVHMLTTGAFNALLKTLEEPPPHVKFIFATTEPQKIPVTILSRCQRFDFRRVSVQQLVEHVKKITASESVSLSPSALTTVVREAQGSVRDALSLLDQVLSFAGNQADDAQVAQALGLVERETIVALAEALLARDGSRLLELVAEVDARGHDLSDVAGLLVEHVRDLMVVKVTTEPVEAVLERSPGEVVALRAQADKATRPDLHRLFAGLVSVAEDVNRSAHPRVSLEMGLLRLLELEPAASLTDLLGRLDALAGGAPPASGGPGGGARPAAAPAPAARATSAAPVAAPAPSRPSTPAPGPRRDSAAAPASAAPRRDSAGSRPASPDAMPPDDDEPPPLGELRPPRSAPPAAAAEPRAVAEPRPAPAARPAPEPIATRGDKAVAAARATPRSDAAVPNIAWARLVERVKVERPAIASVLEHAQVLRFGPDGVELGFPARTFYWESAKDPEVRALLARMLAEQFGQAVRLELSALDPGAGDAPASLAAAHDESRRRREREIHETAIGHPAVKQAISVLGGEVTAVKPLADLDDPGHEG